MASRKESGSSSRSSTSPLRVGRVGRPHGTDGAFSVVEPTARLDLLDPGRTVAVAGRDMTVAWRKGTPGRPLVKLEEADGREAAARLRGAAITVPREALGALAEGEYLVEDLVGCEVLDGARRVGRVRDVLSLPSADALEVEREGGGQLLVPLVGDAVRAIDVEAGRVEVRSTFIDAD